MKDDTLEKIWKLPYIDDTIKMLLQSGDLKSSVKPRYSKYHEGIKSAILSLKKVDHFRDIEQPLVFSVYESK